MNEFIVSTGSGERVISSGDDGSRKGSRKGDRDIVQEIIDKFDDIDNTSNEELIKLAKELPDGKGEDVIVGLGVGWWRGDEPEEQEFFRIIDSKYDKSRNGKRKGSRKGNSEDDLSPVVRNHDEALKNVEKIASIYNLTLTDQSHGNTSYKRDVVSVVDGERYPYGFVELRAWGYGKNGDGSIILNIWYKQSEFDFVGSTTGDEFDKNTTSIDIQSYLDKLGLKFK